MQAVRVNRKAVDRVRSGHPWIFSSDVTDRGSADPGDAVVVNDPRGQPLGTAHYSSTSQICLRMLSRAIETIDRQFLKHRLEAALAYRQQVVDDSEAYRLVYGEADLLPGLVIDRYADFLVLQTLDQGMDRLKSNIAELLQEVLNPQGIVERNDASVRLKESLPRLSGVLTGAVPPRITFRMHGLTLEADLVGGQKTGAFLDQRENYRAAARYARGRALDCFTSSGGFALHLASRCESVEAVDSSTGSLEQAARNAAANSISNIQFREANAFDLLSAYARERRQFDTIVLDPPAFAKSRSALENAVRGYKEINLRALELLPPEGVLVTCSCSHHLSEAELLGIVASASLDAGRTLRVIERRTQSQDHPILLTVPETHYLKCLILQAL
jgi:23S rRNA (cytosine1962-C5)-methyltransferase